MISFPHDSFNYFFLDDYFNRQYHADLKFGQILSAVFRTSHFLLLLLGYFGLGSYMALQKVKEISIRKVMGATLGQVLILIPKKSFKVSPYFRVLCHSRYLFRGAGMVEGLCFQNWP